MEYDFKKWCDICEKRTTKTQFIGIIQPDYTTEYCWSCYECLRYYDFFEPNKYIIVEDEKYKSKVKRKTN